MFEFFPGNYVWNLGVVAALNSGGLIDEVDRACRPIREAAGQAVGRGHAATSCGRGPRSPISWSSRREEAEKAGHDRTAGQLYFRATNYLAQSERMLSQVRPEPGPHVPADPGAGAEVVRAA